MSFDGSVIRLMSARNGYTHLRRDISIREGIDFSGFGSGDVASVDLRGTTITFNMIGSAGTYYYTSGINQTFTFTDASNSLPDFRSISIVSTTGVNISLNMFYVSANTIQFNELGMGFYEGGTFTIQVNFASAFFHSYGDAFNFNAMSADDVGTVTALGSATMYESLAGNDIIYLPNISRYGLGPGLTWSPSSTFYAGAGDDQIFGGDGADRIDGGPGLDRLFGGAGNDTIMDDPFDAVTGRFGGSIDGGSGSDSVDFTQAPSRILDASGNVVWIPGNTAISAEPGTALNVYFGNDVAPRGSNGYVQVVGVERIHNLQLIGPSFWIENATIRESDNGSQTLFVMVRLSQPSASIATVDFSTLAGSAVRNGDFVDPNSVHTVTFLPGQTSRMIGINIIGDTIDENDETFTVSLSNAQGAGISRAVATVTIVDEDEAFVHFVSAFPTDQGMTRSDQDDSDGNYTFTSRSYGVDAFDYVTSNGTQLAMAGNRLLPAINTEHVVAMYAGLKVAANSAVGAVASAANGILAVIGNAGSAASTASNYVSDISRMSLDLVELVVRDGTTSEDVDLAWANIRGRTTQFFSEAAFGGFAPQATSLANAMSTVHHHSDISTELALSFGTSAELFLAAGHHDSFMGSGNADRVHMGDLSDVAFGGGGADWLFGDGGDDLIGGGDGYDVLSGGTGNDLFIGTAAEMGGDRITDLQVGDRIRITDADPVGFNYSLVGSQLNFMGQTLTLDGFSGRLVARNGPGSGVTLYALERSDPDSDFNGDGRSDVLLRNTNGSVTLWQGQANGSFVNAAGLAANMLGADWRVAGLGDFNGDGRDDILWRHSGGEIGEWLGQSSGPFANNGGAAANAVDASWWIEGIADYNGDGRDDILWRHTSGEVGQWLGQPNGGFANNGGAAANLVDSSWTVVANGDFNGDGRADIVWRHTSGEYAEWQGSASGALLNAGGVSLGSGSVVGSGDFNSDGRDDVLTRAASGSITLHLGQSNGQFSAFTPTNQLNELSWKIVGIGDYNGDGNDDLLWRHSSGEGGQWLGTGNGDFLNNGAIPTVDPAWQVQSPDIWVI